MKDYLNFRGKTAIVTGGRRGLGKAMSIALAECGANVAIVSQSPQACELLEEISRFGASAIYLCADLSKRGERNGLIEKIIKHFGGIDILINNVGFQFKETVETCTLEQWDTSRSTLLDAGFELSQQTIPYMKKQGSGKIINISSICAFREGGWNFSYGVMKGAVVSMTRCMANSLSQYGINVNAIAPGIIRTDLTAQCFEPQRMQKICEKYPTRHLGEPEDIVGAMLFLASDLSRFVHGQTIVVDGGFCGN